MATPTELRRELDDLQLLREEWGRRLSAAAERWVQARYRGVPDDVIEGLAEQMRVADREWRRYDRRIRRMAR